MLRAGAASAGGKGTPLLYVAGSIGLSVPSWQTLCSSHTCYGNTGWGVALLTWVPWSYPYGGLFFRTQGTVPGKESEAAKVVSFPMELQPRGNPRVLGHYPPLEEHPTTRKPLLFGSEDADHQGGETREESGQRPLVLSLGRSPLIEVLRRPFPWG